MGNVRVGLHLDNSPCPRGDALDCDPPGITLVMLMSSRRAWMAAVLLMGMSAGTRAADESGAGTLIRSFSYDAATQTLTIVMAKDGRTYRYLRVSEKVYRDFLAAKSKGTFYLLYIKGRYEYRVD